MTPAPKGMPSPSAPAPHSPAPATPTPCSAPCVRSCPIGMVLGVIAIDRPGRVEAVGRHLEVLEFDPFVGSTRSARARGFTPGLTRKSRLKPALECGGLSRRFGMSAYPRLGWGLG